MPPTAEVGCSRRSISVPSEGNGTWRRCTSKSVRRCSSSPATTVRGPISSYSRKPQLLEAVHDVARHQRLLLNFLLPPNGFLGRKAGRERLGASQRHGPKRALGRDFGQHLGRGAQPGTRARRTHQRHKRLRIPLLKSSNASSASKPGGKCWRIARDDTTFCTSPRSIAATPRSTSAVYSA